MSDPLEPLPPDIEQMLAEERELPAEDPAMKRRVLQAVTLAVGSPDEGGQGSSEQGSGGQGSGGADLATHVASSGSTAVAAATKTLVGVGIAAFVAGGLAGSALTTSMLTVDAPPPALAPTTSGEARSHPVDDDGALPPQPTASSEPRPEASTQTWAPEASGRAAVQRPAPAASNLDLERELLDVARAALDRGNAAGALEALAEHTQRFPGAQLGEERHALMVQALAGAGRRAEARTVAAQFRTRYPKSMLRPVVDAA